jgi:DNA-binding CsgD family transcriptional regulator/PAS domain-containing protein
LADTTRRDEVETGLSWSASGTFIKIFHLKEFLLMKCKNQINADVAIPRYKEDADTFQELCALWQNQPYGDVDETYDHFMEDNPALEMILTRCPCITWIMDLRTLQFVFISPNIKDILGYESRPFLKKGKSFWKGIVHPEDQEQTWKLKKQVWERLLTLPAQERKKYKFNTDYRVVKPDGSLVRILEQSSVLQLDDRGNITHTLSICSDITHWNKIPDPYAAVLSPDVKSCFDFGPEDADGKPPITLSKRELEIVSLMAAGHNSKYIADKLFISFHTVNTHRQKMIEKTSTRNTGGLIQFAMYHGLI